MRRGAVLLVALALAAGTASAAETDRTTRAVAAGYKASFLCSDIFNAGLDEGTVAALEWNGAYPEYRQLVETLPAVVDRSARTVSVAYDPVLPPRIAAWRPTLGCAQYPAGKAAADLPMLALAAPDLDARDWPLGDVGAVEPLRGAEAEALDRVVDAAIKAPGTSAVLVLRGGRIVAERYALGIGMHTPQRTWSVAKSLTATLIGRAVQLGRVQLDEPAPVPEWAQPSDPRAAITFAQLLRMNSGLATGGPGNRSDAIYFGGASVAQMAARMPIEAPPGTRFRYANDDMLLAMYALKARIGADAALAFPFTELLWPIGMTRTTPETDWAGNFVLSSQVWMTARDLARLALLYRDDGMANGVRLLPEGWAKLVATPAGAQPDDGRGYGAGFWLWGPRNGLPEGSYSMNGRRGQYAMIVPAADVIIVRRGFDPPGQDYDIAGLTAKVLGALPQR